jgi:hypothetical protein
MDDESKQLLRQLIDTQKEQTELLRRHVLPLWTRIRFSLLALLVLMTLVATGVGFSVWAIRSRNASTAQPAITFQAAPTGRLQLWPSPAPVNGPRSDGTISFGGQIEELPADDDIPSLASPVVSP